MTARRYDEHIAKQEGERMSNHGWAGLTRRQADVAEVMRAIGGPCTADDISAWVEEHEGRHVGASLSSRLHELVDRGVVEATGDRAATRSGRTARLYRLCSQDMRERVDADTGLAAAAELRELRDIVAGILDLIADRLETGDIMFGARP